LKIIKLIKNNSSFKRIEKLITEVA